MLEIQRDDLYARPSAPVQRPRPMRWSGPATTSPISWPTCRHELRTPLELLADSFQACWRITPTEISSAEQVKYAQTIQSAGNDLLARSTIFLTSRRSKRGTWKCIPSRSPSRGCSGDLTHGFSSRSQRKRA